MKHATLVLSFPVILLAGTCWGDQFHTGTFVQDDDIVQFDFTKNDNTPITLKTLSYGGGTTSAANGSIIVSPGGFDTYLALYSLPSGVGDFIAATDDDSDNSPVTGLTIAGNVSGQALDAILLFDGTPRTAAGPPPNGANNSTSLPVGNYRLVLTQWDNRALGDFSAGFSRAGQGNFTGGPFLDGIGFPQNGNYAVEIIGNVSPLVAGVPEPTTFVLAAIGLLSLFSVAWRRRKR